MKKLNYVKLLLAAIFALGGVFLANNFITSSAVQAEEGQEAFDVAMTVSPKYQDMILIPGQQTKGSITVSNPNSSTQNLKYSVKVGSFYEKSSGDSLDDYGDEDLSTISSYNQLTQWIELAKTSGEVAPNQTDTIPFVINVPADAPAGGQYASLLVSNDTVTDSNSGGNVQIQNEVQIASILYGEVTGSTRQEAEILENSFPSFLLSPDLTATSMVKNNGNIHTYANYALQVWPLFNDEEVCTNEEKPNDAIVLPDTKRYHTEECTLPVPGLYRVKQTVTIFGETSILERTIMYLPAWLIVIIIALIAVAVFFIVRYIRNRKTKRA